MLLGLTYQLIRFIADLVLVRTRSDAQLRAEVLALRHQLRMLERRVGKPTWQPADRLLLAALSRLLPRSGWSALLPRPETWLRWHRDLVRRKWVAFRQRPLRQRPARDPERRALILRLAGENPRWGYRRIQGEALKLGFQISQMQVATILRTQRIPPAPRRSQSSWREFVCKHAAQTLATDFFTVETAWLQRLHVLFFELASRKVHLGGITASPTGEWVAQQAPNLAWKVQDGAVKAKFLLRDRDSNFTASFDQVFGSEGVKVLRLPYRAPRANSIAERFVLTARPELLDHMLIFSARHLEAVIKEFLVHYHQARPQRVSNSAAPNLLSRPLYRGLAAVRSSATTASEGYSTSTPGSPDRVDGGIVTPHAAYALRSGPSPPSALRSDGGRCGDPVPSRWRCRRGTLGL